MGLLWYFRTLHLLFLREKTGVYSRGGDRRNLLVERFSPANPTAGVPTGRIAGGGVRAIFAVFLCDVCWLLPSVRLLLSLLPGALCSLSLLLLFSVLLCLPLCCTCFCFHSCDCCCEGCGECVRLTGGSDE